MALTPGLSPNIRLDQLANSIPFDVESPSPVEIEVDEVSPGDEDNVTYDNSGNIIRIDHADGSVTVSLDGKPISRAKSDDAPTGWFENIADRIEDQELSRITDELLRGIDNDIQSRTEWIDDRATGIRLLGLKVEMPGISGTSDGAPVEGMSRVRHPLLLEAVLRYQANARSELLPTDGPVKIRDDSNNGSPRLDELADAFEKDMNHYLTVVATEYYPDTDRMLFMQGFGGCGFKKVYNCPLRNRPVSESIDADDLIVNNQATDLQNAKRVTHRIMMRPSVVKRMQLLGAYRDIPLSDAQMPTIDAAAEQKAMQQGISPQVLLSDDRDREIYECYCELDISGHEHKKRGRPTGLELPYCVTIDKSSRKILSVVRNYDEGEDLPTAKKRFVKFPFVPGLGFYDIGLLHILGNTTNAVTAAWRELLDAGMYSNFPGFLYADQGARQNTNIFRVPPGGGAMVKTGGMPISQAIMPLPYKEPSGALFNLATNIAEYGQRVGGTAEVMVGEGKQDAPVGTTLALIEQATKVLNSVHKRLHAAQSEEFQLLVDCFRENPEAFWQFTDKPSYPWDESTFRLALDNYYLVPQADPNTSSSTHRMMKAAALVQLASAAPQLYNLPEVNKEALRVLGFTNIDQFIAPPNQMPPMDVLEKMGKMKIEERKVAADEKRVNIEALKASAEAQKSAAELGIRGREVEMSAGGVPGREDVGSKADLMNAQAAIMEAIVHDKEVQATSEDSRIDGLNRAKERESRERLAKMNMQRDILNARKEMALAGNKAASDVIKDVSRRLNGKGPREA